MPTSAIDVVIAMWRSLDPDERESVYHRIHDLRLIEQAGEESEAARLIRSLRRVAEIVDDSPSPDAYKEVRHQLLAAGEDIASFTEQTRHFRSWRRAKEALALSETKTPRRIDARFRYRRLGKVWRYSEATLRDTLMACAEHCGRAPSVAEFEWWREREIQKGTGHRRHRRRAPAERRPVPQALEDLGRRAPALRLHEQATERFQQR